MRKILLLIIVSLCTITLLESCSLESKENKARRLIEKELKSRLVKPETFEFADMKLDSCFTNDNKNKDYLVFCVQLCELGSQYKEQKKNIEEAQEYAYIFRGNKNDIDKANRKIKFAQYKIEDIKNKVIQAIKDFKKITVTWKNGEREFSGWCAVFEYRAETAGGIKRFGQEYYFFDKELKNITYSISAEDLEKYTKVEDALYEFREEFGEELQGLFENN